ncbi:MAG: histone deacetylase family protein [Rhodospirillales bacterium]|nr:histone deacetylase family protein [Rhodospirillales bacterium]
MPTFLYMPSQCFEHDTGYGHPECSERLRTIDNILSTESFAFLQRTESGPATRKQIERAHNNDYVSKILAYDGYPKHVELDEDTVISSGSIQAALYAAGAACQAVDDVMTKQARNAFCAIRPPGHHAEAGLVMGFCLFNNAAIAALHAQEVHGVKRVAVIDFDVHHGNGVQSIFWDKPDLCYVSLHEDGGYPQTGPKEETGAAQNIINVPLHAGSGTEELQQAWTNEVLPRLKDFDPELIIISAGFDAHQRDLMGGLNYTTSDYAWLSAEIVKFSTNYCNGRVVSLLEGGYDLPALAASVGVHVKVLMEV